uniref:Liprin-beta-1/2 coiled-coil domain-containing protein n=1 Tax=Cynoglossus semilaevis TaxID=244447 RepID=A0A3P8WBW0_CYNSE
MASNASHMLENALQQMDDIIAGKRCCLNLYSLGGIKQTLQLIEGLRAALEAEWSEEEKLALRERVSADTASVILKWIDRNQVNRHPNSNSDSYQERLSRLEGDKESLVLQVSVLTDQVEAQGSKISDLESSLVEYQQKLNSTEEMLQQELLHRTSLEGQKLSLMGEVSYLKLKLADMEGKQQSNGAERQHKAEFLVWKPTGIFLCLALCLPPSVFFHSRRTSKQTINSANWATILVR